MALTTLTQIRQMARRLTRTPSLSQMADFDLDQYINNFILYDFPSNLRLFSLRTVLTFYTQPFVDKYSTNTTDILNPLYNFRNKYIAVHQPVFFAGIQGYYTQERDVFYGYYPQTNSIIDTQLRGNGLVGPFNGVVSSPVLQNNVIFTCLDLGGNAMTIVDYPVSNTTGALGLVGQPQTIPSPYGQINYVTGAFTVNFVAATQANAPITAEVIAYQPGKPLAMLYYDDAFVIRPVPDKLYQIQVEADMRPTELLLETDVPYLEQWWTYISMGAAKRIFIDRGSMDDLQWLMPLFLEQEMLVQRATIMQQANERTITIYTQSKQMNLGWFGAGWPY